MPLHSTNTVFEVIKGEIAKQLGDSLDDVLIFDGTLNSAIEEHFGTVRRGAGRVVFVTLTDGSSNATSGYGVPVRDTLLVDIYIVFRVQGRGRYERVREDLWDVSDHIVRELFVQTNCDTKTNSVLAGRNFISRSRQLTRDDIMTHLIRYEITPQNQ